MTQAVLVLLQLNLWALLVWLVATAAARRFEALAAWPAYWIGAVAVTLAPPALGLLAPEPVRIFAADLAADGATEILPRTMAFLYGVMVEFAGIPLAETAPAAPASMDMMIAATAETAPRASEASIVLASAEQGDAPAAVAPVWTGWIALAAFVALAAYAAGATLATVRLAVAHARIRLLAHRAARLDAPSDYPVRVVQAELPPCALGLPAPRILVPARLLERLADDELNMILRHESAHIRHRDPETNFVLGFVEALFWLNPAVRSLVARWRLAAEIAADEAVASGQPKALRTRYARLLVAALRSGGASVAAPSVVLRMDHKGSVKMRLAAILGARASGGDSVKLAASAAGAGLLCAGALACAAFAQAPQPPAAPEAPEALEAPAAPAAPAVPVAISEPTILLAQAAAPAPAANPAPAPAPEPAPAPSAPAAPAAPAPVLERRYGFEFAPWSDDTLEACSAIGRTEQVRVLVERTNADGEVSREETVSEVPDQACVEEHVRQAIEQSQARVREAVAEGQRAGAEGRRAALEARLAGSVQEQNALQRQLRDRPGMSAEDRAELNAELAEMRAELEQARAERDAELAAARAEREAELGAERAEREATRAEWEAGRAEREAEMEAARAEMEVARAEMEADRAEREAEMAEWSAEWAAEAAQWGAEFGAEMGAHWAEWGARFGEEWGDAWAEDREENWNPDVEAGNDRAPRDPNAAAVSRILEGGPEE